jgi:hypothetical protein
MFPIAGAISAAANFRAAIDSTCPTAATTITARTAITIGATTADALMVSGDHDFMSRVA